MSYVILSRPNCPFCTKAEDLLKEHRMPWKHYDIYEDKWLLTLVKEAGHKTVAIIFDETGKHIGGYTDLEKHIESIG